MESSLTDTQNAFIQRYLGGAPSTETPQADATIAAPATPDQGFEKSWNTARSNWLSAEEAVGKQITAMQAAFRKSGSDVLLDIANFGLPALTGNTRSKAMTAIFEVEGVKSAPNGKILMRADKKLSELQKQLTTNPRVQACDENPFGVKVSIIATLGGALDDMRKTIQAGVPK